MKREPIPSEFLGSYPRLLAVISDTGRLPRRDELDAFRELGERAAESGYGLRGLVGLYLTETRRLWATLPGVLGAGAIGPRGHIRTGDSVLAAVDAVVAALGEGHERAQRLAVRQEEGERREFIDDLLYGRSDLGRLAERAQRFGLHLADRHVVAVAAAAEKYDDVHPTVRRVERELLGRFGEHDVLLSTKEGRLVCIAASGDSTVMEAFARLAEDPGRGYAAAQRVAFGREHAGAGGVVRSYEEAVEALRLADRIGVPAVRVHAGKMLVFPVLLRDREAMADLVRTVLGPLTRARGGARPLLETLEVCAAAGYVNAEAARRLGVSVRTLSYRLERIRTLTGYDPGDALQRFTLETAELGARLLGWPENGV
ncbi:PucR family transcriptional regulator [Streptomyces sp. NPDC048172]|uniref:PucR family transcriptional regulator n=1 Tax=Streptomyces sp. NPDC048172 TaxID=3365505 RepID=UPI0037207D62